MTRCQFIHAPGLGVCVDCDLSLLLEAIWPPFSYSTKIKRGQTTSFKSSCPLFTARPVSSLNYVCQAIFSLLFPLYNPDAINLHMLMMLDIRIVTEIKQLLKKIDIS
jgi:hypothetical protein